MKQYVYSVYHEDRKEYDYYTSGVKPSLFLRSSEQRLHSFILIEDLQVPLPDDHKYFGSGPRLRGAAATSGTAPVFFDAGNFAVTVLNFVVISNVVSWINSLWSKKSK